MARNTAVQVLDDLTGEPAAETVGFGLDGIDYDIDLSFTNAEALRGLLQRYADAGRRTGGRRSRPRIVPGAKKTPPKPAAPAKAAPARAAAKTKAPVAKTAKATRTKAEPAKTQPVKTQPAKAEPAKTTRAKKAAEPKPTTRAAARKVPTVTFSAAE
ncbi:histone-like nucleoid-structuring protein Lsr2 [Amycolatopsis sp. lyj-346]|uniref:Lsr2 dimerization domain-containing protein n=1 Tax=Amycolatopsis sp. lyj-346 TaxID=2789289 RepID=UPI00397809E3